MVTQLTVFFDQNTLDNFYSTLIMILNYSLRQNLAPNFLQPFSGTLSYNPRQPPA